MATQNFINECKNMANANRLGRFELQMYDRFEKEFKGDTYQNTTKGLQLLKKEAFSTPKSDTTFWDSAIYTTPLTDGWCKIERDNTSGTSSVWTNNFIKTASIDYEPNTDYTIIFEWRNASNVAGCNLSQAFSGVNAFQTDASANVSTSSGIVKKLVKTKETLPSNYYGFRNFFTTLAGKKMSLEARVMIVKGDYTNQEVDFEYYTGGTPSPNPDYPQDIQSITGLQNINVCGKNLFDTSNAESRTHNGITFTLNNDGSINADGTATSLAFMLVLSQAQSPLYEAGNYAFSLVNEMPNNCYVRFEFFDSNNTMILRKDITKNGTATLLQNCYLKVSYVIASGTVLNNFVNYIQIEKGSTATTYEPYKSNTYEVNLGKNLFDENYTGITSNLIYKPIYVGDGTFILSTTAPMNTTGGANLFFLSGNVNSGASTGANGVYTNRPIQKQSENGYVTIAYRNTLGVNPEDYDTQLEKGSQATSYSPYFTPIELNKIGTYQDSIKKSTGKNLFDSSNASILNAYFDGSHTTVTSAGTNKTTYLKVQPNTTYTISKLKSIRSFIGTTQTLPEIGTQISNISNIGSGDYDGTTRINGTITTGANDNYIVINYANINTDTGDRPTTILESIQIEQGTQATSYEPYGKVWYIEKKIYKSILKGTENWNKNYGNNLFQVPSIYNSTPFIIGYGLSNYYRYNSVQSGINNNTVNGEFVLQKSTSDYNIFIKNTSYSTVNEFKTWLSNHNTEILFPLINATIEEITNEELIEQLETIELLKGTNNITITSEDLPVIFDYSFWNGDTEIDEDDRFLEINQSNYLTSVELKDSCYVNDTIIGSTYTKNAEVELLNLPIDTKLVGKTIVPEIGVRYNDDTTEYETFDNYTIESVTDEQTASNTKFTAMNGGTLLDKEYICSLSFENGQTHTINEFYQDACSQIGLTPTDSTFDNSELIMTGNPFTNKESIRTLISEVEKTSCTIINFDWKNKTASMTWLSDQIDYEFNTNDYSILEGSMTQYGPLNTIIIANTELNGENVVMVDEESIARDGEHQIVIDSPYFLYTEELRTQAIQAIYNKLVGLTYYDLKLTTPYGKPFIKIGNKIRINTNEGQTYDTYVLKHTITYNGAIQSIIESPALTSEEQTIKNEFKGNSVREKLRRTELIVDKTTGDITAITDRVTTVENEFGDVYSKEEVNTLIQNSATGLTNTFSSNGGNNILRNTGLWFEDRSDIEYLYPENSLYPSDELFMKADAHWEYWKGNAEKVKEDKAANMSGILLKTGYFEQTQQVRNGTYTLSFKYRKLNQLANVNIQINNKRIELNNTEDTEIVEVGEVTSQFVDLTIFSDTDDSCVIYDLMINAGSEKAEYSQHQNETTTDTVNISKGITISSSDTNTTFKANSDGIRVYNSKDMDTPVVDFTDTGMNTNRVKVKEEAEIVKVLWKNVGNNTWITRL